MNGEWRMVQNVFWHDPTVIKYEVKRPLQRYLWLPIYCVVWSVLAGAKNRLDDC